MSLRRVLFWIHFTCGCVAGLLILVMSVTGVLLAFERQITAFADREYVFTPPAASAAAAGPGAVLLAACSSGRPTAESLSADPSRPVEISSGRDRTVFFNPYTAQPVGVPSPPTRRFFQAVEAWHRWIGISARNHAVGRAITGYSNLAFFLLVTSGLVLWWPRRWSRHRLRRSVTLHSRFSFRRSHLWNWHSVIGFWCFLPLLIIVASGVVMSFSWANNLVYRMTGNQPPPPPRVEAARTAQPPRAHSRQSHSEAAELPSGCNAWDTTSMDRLWQRAEAQVPGWKHITLRLPESGGGPAIFSIDQGDGGRPDLRSQLTLDWHSADVLRWEPFSSYNLGRRLRAWIRFSHTGEAGGLVGQLVAAFVTLATIVLAITGLSMAVRRMWPRQASANSAALRTSNSLGPKIADRKIAK